MDARPWPAPAGLAAVSVAAAAVLVGSGVAAGDVVSWFAVVGAGVMLPGLVVVRAVRGPGPLAEDLAWSLPLGFVLALLTWGLGLALGMPVSPFWTGVASLALLLVPAVRRRVLGSGRPSQPGWGMGSGSVVVASLVAAAAWAGGSALASLPTDPDRAFVWAPDTMFHAALAGEMVRTAAPLYPMVPEGPYAYHWFFHALAAHLGQGFGPLVVVTHLLPLTLLLAVVAMAAVAARAVARHRWGAAAGAAAVGLAGMTAPSAWVVLSGITGRSDTDGAGMDPIRLYWQHSASTTLGWLAALAIVAASARVLRDGVAERRGDVALVLAMGALAAGAKSVQTPVLLCGFAAVLLLALVRRRWSLAGRVTLVASLLGGTWLVAVLTMYAGGSAGLEVSPGARAEFMITRMVPALADGVQGGDAVSTPVVGSVLVALWLLPLVPRLLGLLWFVRRPVDPMGLLCGATLAAGVIGTFLTTHPGRSEVFFLVCAYPVGVVGSAAGLVLAADRLRVRWGGRAVVRACAIAATVGAATTALVASWAGDVSPLVRWRAARPDADVPGDWLSARSQLLAWGAPTLVLLVATALATIVGVLFCGRPTAAGIRRRSAACSSCSWRAWPVEGWSPRCATSPPVGPSSWRPACRVSSTATRLGPGSSCHRRCGRRRRSCGAAVRSTTWSSPTARACRPPRSSRAAPATPATSSWPPSPGGAPVCPGGPTPPSRWHRRSRSRAGTRGCRSGTPRGWASSATWSSSPRPSGRPRPGLGVSAGCSPTAPPARSRPSCRRWATCWSTGTASCSCDCESRARRADRHRAPSPVGSAADDHVGAAELGVEALRGHLHGGQ